VRCFQPPDTRASTREISRLANPSMRKNAKRLFALLWVALCVVPNELAVAAAIHTVVVLYSDDRFLPANTEADRGLRAALANNPDAHVELFDEHLDHAHFGAPSGYEQTIVTYLHDKYASRTPGIIVVGGDEALDFVLRNRKRLFPQAAVVHMGVDRSFLQSIPDRPADLIGVPIEIDVSGTIDQALRWHPLARLLVIVTGTAASDRDWEMQLRGETARLKGRATVEFLAGLPTAVLTRRLAALGPNTVVFTPGYYEDGTGSVIVPRESAELMAAASAAPIYSPFDTFIGTGVVGGRMASYDSMGRQAGAIVTALVAGSAPATLALPKVMATDLHVDWRQVKRWGIDESSIPKQAIVHFRDPSLWDAYRKETIAVGSTLLLLGGLSIRLLAERRSLTRTTAALRASEQSMSIAARAAKLAMWTWNVAADRILVAPSQTPFQSTGQSSIKFTEALAGVHPADREEIRERVQKALVANDELDLEYRTVPKGGEVRWIAIRGRRDHGNESQWLGIVLDITDRKQAQLQAEQDRSALQHMTRVSIMGQISASIAHELNQPLGAISNNAGAAEILIRADPPNLKEVTAILGDIKRDNRRASDIISKIRKLLRKSEFELQDTDLNEAIDETMKLISAEAANKNVSVKSELEPGLAKVSADRVQLQQVILNLALNAMDAMLGLPVGKKLLTIRSRRVIDRNEAEVSVADSGHGIPIEMLPSMFGLFVTSKPSGMGLGLAISRTIVEAHGGQIHAENALDGGAVIRFTLQFAAVPRA
jgi:C4-dicarboxylate-specific signal transduction histidine kinase